MYVVQEILPRIVIRNLIVSPFTKTSYIFANKQIYIYIYISQPNDLDYTQNLSYTFTDEGDLVILQDSKIKYHK